MNWYTEICAVMVGYTFHPMLKLLIIQGLWEPITIGCGGRQWLKCRVFFFFFMGRSQTKFILSTSVTLNSSIHTISWGCKVINRPSLIFLWTHLLFFLQSDISVQLHFSKKNHMETKWDSWLCCYHPNKRDINTHQETAFWRFNWKNMLFKSVSGPQEVIQ